MWYPNRPQWWVIWITVVLTFAFAGISDGNPLGPVFVAVVGLLIIWRLKGAAKSGPEVVAHKEDSRKENGSQKESLYQAVRGPGKFCVECGTRLEASWKHCPECGTEAQSQDEP
jgi:zinc-ribbon domain